MKTRTLFILAASAVPAAAFAQETTQAPSAAERSAVDDVLFAQAAASGGLAEVRLAELGVQKATDPELKRFSQKMVDEHSRMNARLTDLAGRKRVELPKAPDARAQFCEQGLAGLSGAEFDRCYAMAQLVAHLDSVATFEAESVRGRDSQMKELAGEALPHIKEHLKEIKPIAMKYEKEKPSAEEAPAQPR